MLRTAYWHPSFYTRRISLVRKCLLSFCFHRSCYIRNSSRHFLGDDSIEYSWKFVKGIGCVVSPTSIRFRRLSSSVLLVEAWRYEGRSRSILLRAFQRGSLRWREKITSVNQSLLSGIRSDRSLVLDHVEEEKGENWRR